MGNTRSNMTWHRGSIDNGIQRRGIIFKNTKRTHYIKLEVIRGMSDLLFMRLMTITRLIRRRHKIIITNTRLTIQY